MLQTSCRSLSFLSPSTFASSLSRSSSLVSLYMTADVYTHTHTRANFDVDMLAERRLLHNTMKLCLASLVLDLCGLTFIWLHYDYYASRGRGLIVMRVVGLLLRRAQSVVYDDLESHCFRQAAIAIFVLLLLLVCKGYTITRNRLSRSTTIKLIIFMSVFTTAHIMLLVWELVVSTQWRAL